jgi:hypothetical protein
VKLFQNLTSGFGEESFWTISSCLYSAKRPHSPEPCLWTDQNFAKNLWKGSHKEHSCEINSLVALERLYRSNEKKILPSYLRNTTMKFGKSPVNSFWGEVFLKKRLTNAHTHAHSCFCINLS